MREHFEEFVKKSQKPAFTIADLKRAVRSENFPHNQFKWKGNAHDADILCAEDVYLGLKLLSRLHPEPAVDDMIRTASDSLRTAVVEKIKGLDPERSRASGERPLYKDANELEDVFASAIDRALDRLMARVHRR